MISQKSNNTQMRTSMSVLIFLIVSLISIMVLIGLTAGCSKSPSNSSKVTEQKSAASVFPITERPASNEKLSNVFKEMDSAQKPQAEDNISNSDAKIMNKTVEEFEKLKGIDLDNAVIEDIARLMLRTNNPNDEVFVETFNSKGVKGCSAKFSYGFDSVIIFSFPDKNSAMQYMLAYESRLPEQAYGFVGRLDYGETSTHFYKENYLHMYVLQNGRHLILMRKYVSS